MLKFDAEITKLLETAYAGSEFAARRRASFDALAPAPGDRVLDIGCGNGTLLVDIARRVDGGGEVTGLDPSRDMLDAARARGEGLDNLRFVEGRATDLPFEDESFDKAVSLQVFEYVEDVETALSEVARVLRTGGRFVIADLHFDTWVWASDDPARMQRMMKAWGHHAVHWDLPERLPSLLEDAGFLVDAVTPHTTCDHQMRPDGYGAILIPLMESHARETGLVGETEIDTWADEQRQRAHDGRYFLSLTQFVITARLPG